MKKREVANAQNCINSNVRKASRAITKLYVSEMHESGLQGTQFTLLATISGHVTCTVTELADSLVMDQTTVTRSVNKLSQNGYVDIFPGADRRERILRLTEKGQETLKKSYPMWQAVQAKVWHQLGSQKVEQLLQLIDEIVEISQRD